MTILFYSDPHVGLSRQTNTTAESAERWREACFRVPYDLLSNNRHHAVCLGDLFDSHTNKERDIFDGARLLSFTNNVLAGNHDVDNRVDRISSLELLDSVAGEQCAVATTSFGESGSIPVYVEADNVWLSFVPHTASQELFEESLKSAEKWAKGSRPRGSAWKLYVLCLHCNYNLGEHWAASSTTLNLTQERAYELLGSFHYILIGHEHTARTDPGTDRIQLLGSTFPTSFSDLTDKFYWILKDGVLTKHLLWSAAEEVFRGKSSEVSSNPNNYSFYDLEDDLPPGESSRLVSRLYKLETTLAVRLSKPGECEAKTPETQAEETISLPDQIEQALQDKKPLLELFKTYRKTVEGAQ